MAERSPCRETVEEREPQESVIQTASAGAAVKISAIQVQAAPAWHQLPPQCDQGELKHYQRPKPRFSPFPALSRHLHVRQPRGMDGEHAREQTGFQIFTIRAALASLGAITQLNRRPHFTCHLNPCPH